MTSESRSVLQTADLDSYTQYESEQMNESMINLQLEFSRLNVNRRN